MKHFILSILASFTLGLRVYAEYADVDVIGGLCVQNHILGPEVDPFDLEGRWVLLAPGGGFCNADFSHHVSTDPRLLVIVSHFHKYHCLERSLVNMFGYTTLGISQTPIYDSVYPIGVKNDIGVGDGDPLLISPLGKVQRRTKRIPRSSDWHFKEWQNELVKDALPYIKGTLLMAPAPEAFPKLREELIAGTNVEKRLAEVREKIGTPDVDEALKSIDGWFARQRTMIEIEAGFPPKGWYPRRASSRTPSAHEYTFGSRVDEHGTLLATAIRRYERLKATSPAEAEKVREEVKRYLTSEQCQAALKANRALMDLHREVEAYGYCGKNGLEARSASTKLTFWKKVGSTWDRGFCVSKELEERYESIKAQLRESSPSGGWIHRVNPQGETLAITCRAMSRTISDMTSNVIHLGGPEVNFQDLGSQIVVVCGKDEMRFSQMPRDDLSYYRQPKEFRNPAWNRKALFYTGKYWRFSPSGDHTNNMDLWFDLLTGKEIFGEMPIAFWQWRFLEPYITERMRMFACNGTPGRGKELTLILVPRTKNTLFTHVAQHFKKNPHVKVIVSLTHGSDAQLPADATYTNLVYWNCDADLALLYDKEGRLVFAMSGVQCNLDKMNNLIPNVEYWEKRLKDDKIDTEERTRWCEFQSWKVRHLIQMDPPSAIYAYQLLKKRIPEAAAEYTETIERLMNDAEVRFWRDLRNQVYKAHKTKNLRKLTQLQKRLTEKLPEIKSLPLRITANTLQQDLERFISDIEGTPPHGK